MSLHWEDVGEIADEIYASYPETDPLSVSFPRLHQMIIGQDNFVDDPDRATERRLEEIQMSWYDLVAE